jgi:hypothetical protein
MTNPDPPVSGPPTVSLKRSINFEVNKALVLVVCARLVVTVIGGIAALLSSLSAILNELANSFFTFEIEGARRYETLTGVRLGAALGRGYRYTDLHDPADGRFPCTVETGEEA